MCPTLLCQCYTTGQPSSPLFSNVRFLLVPTSAILQLLQGTGVIQSQYPSHHFCIAAAITAAATTLPAILIKALAC